MWRRRAFWPPFIDFATWNALADTPAQRQQLSDFHDGRELEHFGKGNMTHRLARVHQESGHSPRGLHFDLTTPTRFKKRLSRGSSLESA
jgi:hypothetical protein